MNITRAFTVIALLILTWHNQATTAQTHNERTQVRSSRPRVSPPPKPGPTATPATNKYWAAQRSIAAAIQQLEEYLRASPDGDRASTARQQLTVLRNLTSAVARPEWAPMSRVVLREVPEWRVASVNLQADQTRMNVEVRCRREDGGGCYFRPFDRFPLVLVDSAGRYYPMLDAGDRPPDVRQKENDERVVISSGRIITITVTFAPLAEDVIAGQIYYRDENQAMPARFSMGRPK